MSDPGLPAPLIITLRLDAGAQAYFDALRTKYFPAERLFVGAHVTMFHALPGLCEREVMDVIQTACAAVAEFSIRPNGLRFLGRGVAIDLAAPEAIALRAVLAARFAPYLTRQDNGRWSPHITIQNKVDPVTARQTMALLAGQHYADPIMSEGLSLWRYQGGPWQSAADFDFAGGAGQQPIL
jgi:hypothetical protein